MAEFKVAEGSLQHRFLQSRAKIQLYGGGFANGKTSAACIKALQLAQAYPGSNGLIARATLPKLNDTIRKEFEKWCPKHWIANWPKSVNSSNTCTLTNGTTINFRYVAQQGKNSSEASTSNLLSATYDWIIVDQVDDPEIVYKDFLDLLGRLRGMTKYVGDDESMPNSGPRWLIITCNPTRGWPYRLLVKPLYDWRKGIKNDALVCLKDEDGAIVLKDGRPIPLMELFEGATYENRDNLTADFIQTLESAYQGQMKDRYLLGKWAAFEGLVYPTFDENIHVVSHALLLQKLSDLEMENYEITYIEGYDYGLAVPACYLCGFVDDMGNVFLVDGFYKKEMLFSTQVSEIKRLREEYGIIDSKPLADPDIFRRKSVGQKLVGKSLASMFQDEGIQCQRGNNDIKNGIVKVSQYLSSIKLHRHPIHGTWGAPRIYFSDRLTWVAEEFTEYAWKRDTRGEVTEEPVDKNDHAMDTIKYILSVRPDVSKLPKWKLAGPVGLKTWGERDIPIDRVNIRHG